MPAARCVESCRLVSAARKQLLSSAPFHDETPLLPGLRQRQQQGKRGAMAVC